MPKQQAQALEPGSDLAKRVRRGGGARSTVDRFTAMARELQHIQDATRDGDLAALRRELDDGVYVLPPELVRRVVEYAFHVGDY